MLRLRGWSPVWRTKLLHARDAVGSGDEDGAHAHAAGEGGAGCERAEAAAPRQRLRLEGRLLGKLLDELALRLAVVPGARAVARAEADRHHAGRGEAGHRRHDGCR
eukprot:scaffold61844_cov56-Phaeocystis_antarctica.AAC.2